MSEQDHERVVVAGAIVRAWREEPFRVALLADPTRVLREAGLDLPPDARVTVLENTESVVHAPIPRASHLAAGARERFAADLAALLPLPTGVELRLHQETEKERFLILPLPPAQTDGLLDDAVLDAVAGGNGGNGGEGGLGLWSLMVAGNGGAGGLFGAGGNGGAGGRGGNGGAGGIA